MLKLLSLASIFTFVAFGPAAAHEIGAPHSHPHLMISNELLAAILLAGAFSVFFLWRRASARKQSRTHQRKDRT